MPRQVVSLPEVLLVEDCQGDARLIREFLRETAPGRMHVHHVKTLEQAEERLRRGGIGAVLLDLGLPGSTGLNTITQLGLNHHEVPFIVLTGIDDDDIREGAAALGAEDYLTKNDLDGVRLFQSLQHAFNHHNSVRRHEARPRHQPAAVDEILQGVCNRIRGRMAPLKLETRAGDAVVGHPHKLERMMGNFLLGLHERLADIGAHDVEIHVSSFRCGSRVALVTKVHIEQQVGRITTNLLEPFLSAHPGDSPSSTSGPELAEAAELLRRLEGQIRFGTRPGAGLWVEMMVPVVS